MNRFINLLFMLLLLTAIYSCRKDDQPKSSSIEIGQTDNMEVQYNSDRLTRSASVYLDDNSSPEFSITHSIKKVSAMVNNGPRYVEINCLNNNKIVAHFTKDSIYSFTLMDTSYSGNNVTISTNHYITCKNSNPNASFSSIRERYTPHYFEKSESLSLDDDFTSNETLLHYGSYNLGYMTYSNNDTTKYTVNRYQLSCQNLSYDQDYYIGFLIEDEQKLGWFKFSIHPNYEILISEVAVQM